MEESLQIFAAGALVAKPGTKFHYSTYGYTVLGGVLEGAASEKYADYVKENIFEPAGMAETQVDNFLRNRSAPLALVSQGQIRGRAERGRPGFQL
jgi:CubicO group peptidase (beta-lactamase class C family)